MDGSEARGSSNASIIVKYGTYSGLAKFIVWMPEFPLEVSVTDFRLSQIKGWKIPDDTHPYVKSLYFPILFIIFGSMAGYFCGTIISVGLSDTMANLIVVNERMAGIDMLMILSMAYQWKELHVGRDISKVPSKFMPDS